MNLAQSIGMMGSFSVDLVTGLCSCSPELARLFELDVYDGFDAGLWLGKIHADDRQLVSDAWSEAVAGAPYDLIYRIAVSTGIRYIRATARFQCDASGRAISARGTNVDITSLMPEGYVPSAKRLPLAVQESQPSNAPHS